MVSSAQVGLSRKSAIGSASTVASVARSIALGDDLAGAQVGEREADAERVGVLVPGVAGVDRRQRADQEQRPVDEGAARQRLHVPGRHAAGDQAGELGAHLHRAVGLLAGARVDQRIDDELARSVAEDGLRVVQQPLAGTRDGVGEGTATSGGGAAGTGAGAGCAGAGAAGTGASPGGGVAQPARSSARIATPRESGAEATVLIVMSNRTNARS